MSSLRVKDEDVCAKEIELVQDRYLYAVCKTDKERRGEVHELDSGG